LGHVISETGIATDPEKTKIVESWPVPTNVKELRSFMGFCGYYRKFIQNFSRLAKCLHKLTEKGRKFEWTNECQSTFEELRNKLVSSPILAHPVFPIWIKSTLSTRDATERIGISMLSTWTMYNRHIIGAEYLKPPCHLSFGIFEV
jgi:hypothetical protein